MEIKWKEKKIILNMSQTIWSFANKEMQHEGEYLVPFTVKVPKGSPASMYLKNRETRYRRKGIIKHYVRAILITNTGKDQISYKQIVIV